MRIPRLTSLAIASAMTLALSGPAVAGEDEARAEVTPTTEPATTPEATPVAEEAVPDEAIAAEDVAPPKKQEAAVSRSSEPTSSASQPKQSAVMETVTESAPVVVDTTKPVVTLESAPVIFNSTNVDLVIQANDETELKRIVGNIRNSAGTIVKPSQINATGTSGVLAIDLSALSNGSYNLRYNAEDAAGNIAVTKSFDFTVDNKAPTATVKPESIESDGVYKNVSFKLYDASKIDKIELNGVTKDLSNNTYSDLNGVKPGTFGGKEGLNSLKVYDVAGNVTTLTFTLDTTGPTATVKPEGTKGADGFYSVVSYKLFDNAKVVKATLNGVVKPLTPNQYSDLNDIKPGTFGAIEGENTLVLEDALGNQSTFTFTIDTIKPVINTPAADQWVGGEHEFVITQAEANPAKAYVEIQQLVDGKWKKFAGSWVYNTNDLTTNFDTTGLTSGVQSQIKISSWDKAGNQSGASFGIKIDNIVPTITVKPESIGSDGVFSNVSFKLFDGLSGVKSVSVNGVEKPLSVNMYSDLNGVKPGSFGAVEGENTIVVRDVAGNTASLVITLDSIAPTVTNISQEWQTKDGGRTSVTLTFSEAVFGLPQGWNGSGTTWNKVYYNTKPTSLTFKDKAGNSGEYSFTPTGAPKPVPTIPTAATPMTITPDSASPAIKPTSTTVVAPNAVLPQAGANVSLLGVVAASMIAAIGVLFLFFGKMFAK